MLDSRLPMRDEFDTLFPKTPPSAGCFPELNVFNSRSLVFQDLSRMLRLFAVSTSREVARLTSIGLEFRSPDLFFFRQNWEK